jgi:hypothetical protein
MPSVRDRLCLGGARYGKARIRVKVFAALHLARMPMSEG